MVSIPSQYRQLLQQAAGSTGLPLSVVAAQIDVESSFNPSAVSPAGAQGMAQFMPGTWASYGHGSPFNPADAMAAYAAYMKALIRQEHGDVRKALAAYNAGPGNLAAGYGYADHILKLAGQSSGLTAGAGSSTPTGGIGGLLGFPTEIVSFFGDAAKLFAAFFQPATYVRLAAGAFGVILLIAGIYTLGKEAYRG